MDSKELAALNEDVMAQRLWDIPCFGWQDMLSGIPARDVLWPVGTGPDHIRHLSTSGPSWANFWQDLVNAASEILENP